MTVVYTWSRNLFLFVYATGIDQRITHLLNCRPKQKLCVLSSIYWICGIKMSDLARHAQLEVRVREARKIGRNDVTECPSVGVTKAALSLIVAAFHFHC